jgi:hypothetical protein
VNGVLMSKVAIRSDALAWLARKQGDGLTEKIGKAACNLAQ